MAIQANAQIARSSDGNYTYTFWVGDDLTAAGVGLATMNAALDAVKTLAAALAGTVVRVDLSVVSK